MPSLPRFVYVPGPATSLISLSTEHGSRSQATRMRTNSASFASASGLQVNALLPLKIISLVPSDAFSSIFEFCPLWVQVESHEHCQVFDFVYEAPA